MTTVQHVQKILAVMVLASFVIAHVSFAQEVAPSESGSANDAAPEVDSVVELKTLSVVAANEESGAGAAENEPVPSLPAGPPAIQETALTQQESVSGDLLEDTENPEATSTTEADVVTVPPDAESATSSEETIIPMVLGEATTTEAGDSAEEDPVESVVIPGPASLEVVDADIVADDVINPDVVDAIPVIVPPPVEAVAEILAEPEEKGFAFELTGRRIPTKQQLLTSDGEVIDERIIDEEPDLDIDNEGNMTVSGVCGDAYYVVLLYKEADAYERDPRSYILNRAYECNGAYTYSLKDLPQSLPNGTYYLLVGEQGEAGMWLPITSLIEVTINRN